LNLKCDILVSSLCFQLELALLHNGSGDPLIGTPFLGPGSPGPRGMPGTGAGGAGGWSGAGLPERDASLDAILRSDDTLAQPSMRGSLGLGGYGGGASGGASKGSLTAPSKQTSSSSALGTQPQRSLPGGAVYKLNSVDHIA
jgi:hypothetical protein